ncbi:MAG: M24 family metallopeptidase [Vicinamibacterales bacterium]
MSASRRDFIRDMGVGLAAVGASASQLACQPPAPPRSSSGATGADAGRQAAERHATAGSETLLVRSPDHVEPAPVGYDRLPLSWYQTAAAKLKTKAAERGVDVVLLSSDDNIVYFTGCFRHSGERSTWVAMPVRETNTAYWYSPAIDRDLIQTWWATENEYYFCYPHAAGGFPNKGQLARGGPVNLWAWMLEGLRRRGFGEMTIGIEGELVPSKMRVLREILPKAKTVEIGDLCLGMRIIKTPEEIALLQRAYRYFDRIHAFARDYILERGTDATDFEVGQALSAYGINLMMNDVKRDGKPHSAVGIGVTSEYVRAGVATAYPHPNQFFHSKIAKGQPLYVNCDILLGGYGGECYRNYAIAPVDPRDEKMWHVVSDTVRMMVEETVPGRVCSEIAEKIHAYQIKNGMQELIYHRPGHGQGQNFEGHQPPFLALGDDTVVAEGMTFSVEPGLYDANRGIGINPSDRLVVLRDRAMLLSSVPFTPEWSFLAL